MPRPEPPKHSRFKKGQSGNPEGARKHNPLTKALRSLTVDTYRTVIEKVLTGNLAALKQIIEDPKSSALEVGIAKAFANAIQAGDYEVIERIAERIVGKIPDELNVNARNLNANIDAGKIDPVKAEMAVKAALEKFRNEV